MKTNSIPCVKTVQNSKSLSNKSAKTGALVGLATSGIYLAKNFDDIFAKNIRNAKALNKFNPKMKLMIFGIPAAFVALSVGVTSLAGKLGGLIAEKIQAKKLDNAIEQIRQDIQSNQSSVDTTNEEERIGKMIDELAEKSIKDLETPIDFEAIDAQILPQEKIDELVNNPTFKGSDFTMPVYTESVPDIATIDFIKEFGKEYSVPTSNNKAASTACSCGKTHEDLYNIYTDTPESGIAPQDFIELYDKPNRPKLSN